MLRVHPSGFPRINHPFNNLPNNPKKAKQIGQCFNKIRNKLHSIVDSVENDAVQCIGAKGTKAHGPTFTHFSMGTAPTEDGGNVPGG